MPITPAKTLHTQLIRERLPGWVKHTTAANFDDLQQQLALAHNNADTEPDWLANSLPESREAVQAARSRYRDSNRILARTLKPLKGVLAFAEPLLQAHLDQALSQAVDLHSSYLVVYDNDPAYWALAPRMSSRKQSLLQAALQNFGDSVAFIGRSTITLANRSTGITATEPTHPHTRTGLQPAAFVKLCRELDLGGQYQQHLRDVFETPASKDQVRLDSMNANRDLLRLAVALARARQRISIPAGNAFESLLDDAHGAATGSTGLQANELSVYGVPLHHIVMFTLAAQGSAQSQTLLVYLPGELDDALTEHASLDAAQHYLKGRLSAPAFRSRFVRYAPLDKQHHLQAVLKRNLAQQASSSDGVWPPAAHASLYLRLAPIDSELFAFLQERHLQRLKADALVVVVSTAEADEQARAARLAEFETFSLNALNLAAMTVPGLGPVMLAVTAVQLAHEVYEGIEDWQDGDIDGAMMHLKSVALTTGMIVGTTVAIAVAPALIDAMIEVRMPDASPRLAKPDLAPYRLKVPPATDLVANAQGQYLHAERHYIKLGTDFYEQQFDVQQQQWRLRHPERAEAYQPALEHNGQGAWRTVHENPLSWSRATLLRRIGPLADGLSDTELDQACQVSGIRENTLRRLHADSLPLPPLLVDTLQRLKIGRSLRTGPATGAARKAVFDTRYAELAAPTARISALCERFPRLTPPLARYLLDSVAKVHLERWTVPATIPFKLLEEAASLTADIALTRAREGLFWPDLATTESTRLALLCLEHAPGWDTAVHLELRATNARGNLLQKIGSATQPPRRMLVHSTEGFQVFKDGAPLQAPDHDLYGAIFDAISPRYRLTMGLADKDALRQRILSMLARPDHELGTWLWSAQPRNWSYSGRLLGGSGRSRGYAGVSPAASSQEARYRNLYPLASAEEAQARLAQWEASGTPASETLRSLERALQRIKHSLSLWAAADAAREAAREEIIAAWQRVTLREVPESGTVIQLNLDFLELSDTDLASFPALDADFDHVHELSVERNSLTHLPNAFMRHFTRLQRVSLNSCQFTQLPENLGADLSFLDMANNQLVWNPNAQALLDGYPQLMTLSLSNNPLGTPPDLSSLTQLQGLDLHNCQLAAYPVGLEHLDAPHVVDLSGNALQTLPPDVALSPALGRALRLEDNPLNAEALQRIEQFYLTHRIDLLIPDIDYRELLDNSTSQQQASWERLHQELPMVFFRDLRLMFNSPPYAVAPITYHRRLWRLLAAMDADSQLREAIVARSTVTLLDLEMQVEVAQALATPELAARSRTLLRTIVNHVRLRKIAFSVLSLSFGMPEDKYATLYLWALKRVGRTPGIDLFQAPATDEPVILDALVDEVTLPGEEWVEQLRLQLLAVDPTTAQGLDEVLALNHEEEPIFPDWDAHLRDRFAAQFAASRAALDEGLERAEETMNEGQLLVEAQRLRAVYEQRLTDIRRTLTEAVARGTLD